MRSGTYTDQEYDAESGLYNYNARLYDPAVGIFISPDSIVPDLYDPQILNRYASVRNNPLIYVDPSGHSIDTADHDPISDLKDSIDSATSGDDSDQDDENNDNFEIAKIDSPEYEEALRRIEEELKTQKRRSMELSTGLGSPMIGPVLGLPPRIAPKKLPRFQGPKPKYHVNPQHVPGRGLRPGKTPLPKDAESVFKNAVPNDPKKPTAWFGKNADGQIYRFSAGNDGTAHFSGIHGVGDGTRNLTDYAIQRLGGL